MREKLTLAEFEQIKKQLKDIRDRCEAEYEEKKDLLDFNEEEFKQPFINEYLKIQERLLSFDLSEIPFEAWEDLEIISEEDNIADFSGTNANIDLRQNSIYYANLKGCNIKNYDKYMGDYPTLIVDDEVKKAAGFGLISLASPILQEKFYKRSLEIDDVIDNIDLFENIRIEKFLKKGDYQILADELGDKNLIKVIKQHPDFIKHIDSLSNIYEFALKMHDGSNLEKKVKTAVKEYCLDRVSRDVILRNPSFLASFNFKIVPEIKTIEDLMKYDEDTFILDKNATEIIELFGINNIKKFEQDTKVFSTYPLDMFYYFFSQFGMEEDKFKDGNLSYLEFQDAFAELLEAMRTKNIFTDYPNYDFITGSFRDKHPEIFIDVNAPKELKKVFYQNRISCELLNKHKEFIPFLIDKDIEKLMKYQIEYYISGEFDENKSLISLYANKYGNKECLEFLAKYGELLDLSVHKLSSDSLNSKEILEKEIRESIVQRIRESNYNNYSYLENVIEFKNEYPELFIDLSSLTNISNEEKEKIKNAYYSRNFLFELIQRYPELINILKDKDLSVPFANNISSQYDIKSKTEILDYILKYFLTNQDFLTLCLEYGKYLTDNLSIVIEFYKRESYGKVSLEDIKPQLENVIARECSLGNFKYTFEDAPRFLKEKNPELFLDEDAPDALKQYFYNMGNNYHLSFSLLSKEKGWLPYLRGKSVSTALLRGCRSNQKSEMLKYFQLFGEQEALKLGLRKSETVEEMIKSRNVSLMKEWYDKTGHKFIPDFVVMQNFPIEEADKFLVSGSLWSKLMQIEEYKTSSEGREALLKLAYSFGVFDQDKRGYQKVEELLTGIPRKLNIRNRDNLELIRGSFDILKKQFDNLKDKNIPLDDIEGRKYFDGLQKMFDNLKKENISFDENSNIFDQIYKENADGTRTLTINPQNHPKTIEIIRNYLEDIEEFNIIDIHKAHQLFGSFDLQYDPDFREFFLKNIDEILENPNYTKMVASIQKQFKFIKAYNSNRTLTLDLAISYVSSNKYSHIEPGNERMAEISSIAGYSQEDFEVLQQIYNYGKQRVFSSIPRVENETSEYTYEILRLDDPLALAIGTLTDCCQELGNAAEVCMEHSMTSTDGRVFVIKDKEGNIIAQSWVWRNKGTLCFDNIEIPDKAFVRAEYKNKTRDEFTKEVYDIYKKAATELIEADEKVYKSLLEKGQITNEQYDGLRLGKITVGLGYNDIASTLKKEAKRDLENPEFPLEYLPPVGLGRSLYTSDSREQFILEERKDRVNDYKGDTLPVHNDTYMEYTDSNFTLKQLLTLEKLEIQTKGNIPYLETNINSENASNLVTKLAINYDLNPKTTKIILHPNFAIIYDLNDNIIRIGDLLFNTSLENKEDIESKVVMQINLALNQIGKDKEIDISNLDDIQKEIYKKAYELNNNQERGGLSAR